MTATNHAIDEEDDHDFVADEFMEGGDEDEPVIVEVDADPAWKGIGLEVEPLYDARGRMYLPWRYPHSVVPTAGSQCGWHRPCLFLSTKVGCLSGEKCNYIHDTDYKTSAKVEASLLLLKEERKHKGVEGAVIVGAKSEAV